MDCKHSVLLLLLYALAMAMQTQYLSAQSFDYPTATAPTSWINGPNIPHTVTYPDGTTIKALLLRRDPSAPLGPSFAAGFYCRSSTPTGSPCRSNFVFGVFTVSTNSAGGIVINQGIPQLVWNANYGGRPFGENAILELTATGEMRIKEADGSFVWFTQSKSMIKELTLFPDGNLRMLNPSGNPVWSSFDFTSNVLLPGRKLGLGMTLMANRSATNYWESGQYMLRTTDNGFTAEFAAQPGLWTTYYTWQAMRPLKGNRPYMLFTNGTFSFFVDDILLGSFIIPTGPSVQFLRLESDGQLRLYQWRDTTGWKPVVGLLPEKSSM